MTDFRCTRRLHAKLMGPVVEVHCRHCSGDRSSDSVQVKVYHRMQYTRKGWVSLKDREDRMARTTEG